MDQPDKSTPVRIQRRRVRGWRMPPNTIYVGRPTRWGNPFFTADLFEAALSQFPVSSVTLDLWRLAGGRVDMLIAMAGRVLPVLAELRGKNLACWCPLDRPCHADMLLEIANA